MTVSYLVCATPRSGSTLLCETLSKTKIAGNPLEFFEALPETGVPRHPLDYLAGLDDAEALALIERAPPPEAPPYSDLRGCADYTEHLEKVRATGTTANGVFGAKIMWAHLVDLGRQLGSGDLDTLVDEQFDHPRFVWVRRQDTVRQAISLWRALQTQSWRAENEPGGEPQYSYAALRHLVELLAAHDRAWEQFLGGKPHVLTLTYEEIASDIGDAVARTLAHIGVAPDAAADALATMRRQADERSDEWAEAYAKDALVAPR